MVHFDYHDKMIIAHAVLASITTLITAPAALLVARYFRSHSWWFRVHMILQTFTITFITIFFTLSTVAVASGGHGTQFSGPHKDLHHDLGLIVVIAFLVQAVLGVVAHGTYTTQPMFRGAFPTLRAKKSLWRRLHVMFGGVAAVGLLLAMKSGLDEWDDEADSKTKVPNGIRLAFWVISSLELAAYLFGMAAEVLHGKRIVLVPKEEFEEERRPSIRHLTGYELGERQIKYHKQGENVETYPVQETSQESS